MPNQANELISKKLRQTLLNWLQRGQGSGRTRSLANASIGISTDIGQSRKENQDKAAIAFHSDGKSESAVIVVSDGMGGMTDGASCASMTVAALIESFVTFKNLSAQKRLEKMVGIANSFVFSAYGGEGGATASVVLIDKFDGTWISNIGDSRIYAIKEGEILQLTVDDTVEGRFGKESSINMPKHAILQHIGIGRDIEIKCDNISNYNNSHSLLLTSDGAHFASSGVILALQNNSQGPEIFSKRLTEVSKWTGSKDNLTAVATRHISSLIDNLRDRNNTGILQVWDAYGDLSIIATEAESEVDTTKEKNEKSIGNNEKSRNQQQKPRRPKRSIKSKDSEDPKDDTQDKEKKKLEIIQEDIFSTSNNKE